MYETIQQIHSFLENVFVKMKISEISSLFSFYFKFIIFFLSLWSLLWLCVTISVKFWLNGWVKTAFHKKRRGLQLIKISSEGDRPQLSAGLLFSDQSYRTLDESLIRTLVFHCLLAESTSFSKKNKKIKKIMRLNLSLIRPNCVRKHFWSDPSAPEEVWSDPIAFEVASDQTKVRSNRLWSDPIALKVASDQTQVRSNPPMIRLFRPNRPLIRPSPDHSPDCSALEIPSRPSNFVLGTHGCALYWVWSETNLGLDLNLGINWN